MVQERHCIPDGTGQTVSFIAAAADNNALVKAVFRTNAALPPLESGHCRSMSTPSSPQLLMRGCDADEKAIRVLFSETVLGAGGGANSATNTDNYLMMAVCSITGASLLADNKTVVLTANDVLTPNQLYNLSIQNVQDRSVSGNVMDPASVPVTGCICTNGVVTAELFLGDNGPNNFITMTNNPKFPNNPDNIYFLPAVNWIQTGQAGSPISVNTENYALRMKGWIVPTASGNYTFGVLADDSGMLQLSTNSNPANLRMLINAPGDCGACTERKSPAVTLVGGQPYYFENALPGRRGWRLSATAMDTTRRRNPDYSYSQRRIFATASIRKRFRSRLPRPNDVTVQECGNATFTVTVNAPNQGPPSYQWYKVGFPIDGATGPSYTLAGAQLFDDQSDFSCHVSLLSGLRQIETPGAFLTVLPDTTPPTLLSAVADDTFHHVTLSFSEPMNAQSATDPTIYSICKSDDNTAARR